MCTRNTSQLLGQFQTTYSRENLGQSLYHHTPNIFTVAFLVRSNLYILLYLSVCKQCQRLSTLVKDSKGGFKDYIYFVLVLQNLFPTNWKMLLLSRSSQFPTLGSNYEGRVSKVVVFIIGGFTYEEAYTVFQVFICDLCLMFVHVIQNSIFFLRAR